MAQFIKFEGERGPVWVNPEHVWVIAVRMTDQGPIIGECAIYTPLGALTIMCSPEDAQRKLSAPFTQDVDWGKEPEKAGS